jgi:hypothetical protein
MIKEQKCGYNEGASGLSQRFWELYRAVELVPGLSTVMREPLNTEPSMHWLNILAYLMTLCQSEAILVTKEQHVLFEIIN